MTSLRSISYAGSIVLNLLIFTVSPNAHAQKAKTPPEIRGQLEAGEEATRIVCFGDSITGVYYHSGSARAWTDMLGINLKKAYPKAKLEMINAGISGHTTANALSRIDQDVISKKPDLVIIMFGMNDVTRVTIDDYEKNLRMITRQCMDAGAAVMLCTPNSVYENTDRPNAKLEAYSERVRKIGREFELPVVDFFNDWSELHQKDATSWMLLMSETIHPNMNGHKRFARLMTQSLSDKEIEKVAIPPAPEPLENTLKLLRANETVKLVAMPPHDKTLLESLKRKFPNARIEVTSWPVENQSLSEIRRWSQKIRKMAPDLVIINVPTATLSMSNEEAFIRDYQWILNNSFHFGKREWDVLAFLSDNKDLPDQRLHLARQIIEGKDIAPFVQLPVELNDK